MTRRRFEPDCARCLAAQSSQLSGERVEVWNGAPRHRKEREGEREGERVLAEKRMELTMYLFCLALLVRLLCNHFGLLMAGKHKHSLACFKPGVFLCRFRCPLTAGSSEYATKTK